MRLLGSLGITVGKTLEVTTRLLTGGAEFV